MARLLLMEDDLEQGFDLASDLRAAGHEVVVCQNGTVARQELEREDYDLLITDLIVADNGRPVPDGGLRLIGWVRRTGLTEARYRHFPIIAITGSVGQPGMEYVLVTAKGMGANAALAKPFRTDDLLRAITRLVDNPIS